MHTHTRPKKRHTNSTHLARGGGRARKTSTDDDDDEARDDEEDEPQANRASK